MSSKKLFSDKRWTEPPGMTSDGKFTAIVSGTKHYASEEERQKDIETTRLIREMLKKRMKENNKNF
ncbi:MAG: hypothetical protein SOH59_08890 [Heyndrickxia faecalis]|jgi:hypothetical protein|uniref:Uncharacterized protein n=4 Tax=Heyndrickxia TaxID=2837504 RepID=G2TMP4_HEYCO|nr:MULTISPECIES: hypothetical protein [Heyndrickxia]AEO99535.1 hypothetical protein Bcoa_0312 [Heyndrickxia coagulans 36D1]AWP36463.1 hypothetical protein CYJ15_05460 [Heyndrickxia coagulans]KWZ79095.1 hypothetical protein HMPREF3213_02810 [Heyndrickxia coagulans]MED4891072.1 hypothetical protein [Weizmannia sp. CD-2023]QDI61968.1 hypothetical protein DXF96_11010 [Heyndrickxia coagulans]